MPHVSSSVGYFFCTSNPFLQIFIAVMDGSDPHTSPTQPTQPTIIAIDGFPHLKSL
jgi:hypothetical protein